MCLYMSAIFIRNLRALLAAGIQDNRHINGLTVRTVFEVPPRDIPVSRN